MSKNKQLTNSHALNELEEIISSIESEEINVDVLSEKVKRAAYLISFCKGRLRNTEEEVKKALSGIRDTANESQGETENA